MATAFPGEHIIRPGFVYPMAYKSAPIDLESRKV